MTNLFFPCEEPLRHDYGRSGIMMIITTADKLLAASNQLDLIQANLRTQGMNKTVREIVDTLQNEPEMFPFKSDPIKLSVDNAVYSYGKKGLECVAIEKLGHGFINGGGRLRAFAVAAESYDSVDLSQIPVFLQVIYGIEDEKQVGICVASNTSTSVRQHSIFNKEGLFDPIKEQWGDKLPYIVYHEGQHAKELGISHSLSPSASITLVLALLRATSDRYDPSKGWHPCGIITGGITSSPQLAKASVNNRGHLLGDLYDVWFYCMSQIKKKIDQVGWINQKSGLPLFPSAKNAPTRCTHFAHTSQKWTGVIGCLIPLPVVAACRVFLVNNHWAVPKSWLMNKAVPVLWKQYQTSLIKSTEVNKYTTLRTALGTQHIWANLTFKAMELLQEYKDAQLSKTA